MGRDSNVIAGEYDDMIAVFLEVAVAHNHNAVSIACWMLTTVAELPKRDNP